MEPGPFGDQSFRILALYATKRRLPFRIPLHRG